jgi:hypothetical protein
VVAACQRYAEAAGRPEPGQMEALKRKEAALTAKISFIMDNSGDTDADRAESKRKIQGLRADRIAVQAQITEVEAASTDRLPFPRLKRCNSISANWQTSCWKQPKARTPLSGGRPGGRWRISPAARSW